MMREGALQREGKLMGSRPTISIILIPRSVVDIESMLHGYMPLPMVDTGTALAKVFRLDAVWIGRTTIPFILTLQSVESEVNQNF